VRIHEFSHGMSLGVAKTSFVFLEESPCPRASSKTNLQVLVLVKSMPLSLSLSSDLKSLSLSLSSDFMSLTPSLRKTGRFPREIFCKGNYSPLVYLSTAIIVLGVVSSTCVVVFRHGVVVDAETTTTATKMLANV